MRELKHDEIIGVSGAGLIVDGITTETENVYLIALTKMTIAIKLYCGLKAAI